MSEQKSLPRLFPGDRLGRYAVRRLLGRGRHAEVYQAFHPDFKRDVAVRILISHPAPPPDLVAAFEQDVKAIIELKHPNIMRVYESGFEAGFLFTVMELVEGTSLRDLLSKHPTGLTREETMRTFRQLVSAVSCAHDQAVIHENIKPDNVLIDSSQRPVLTDFTIPCLRQAQRAVTKGGAATAAYLAPEQVSQQITSPQSDIYSLGILLYEMVTGDVPFRGTSYESVVQQHLVAAPTPPGQIAINLDPRLENLILTALSKKPAERYATTSDMLAALENEEIGTRYETISLQRSDILAIQKRRSEIIRFQQSRVDDPFKNMTPLARLQSLDPTWLIAWGLIAVVVILVLAGIILL